MHDAELLTVLAHKLGHEIGNPLTSIISLASILERFSGAEGGHLDTEKTIRYARSIIKESWRVSALTEKLVLLLSNRAGNPQPQDVVPLIHGALARLRTRRGLDSDWVRISIEDRGTLSAHCDTDQMIVLIAECIENAYQALGIEQTDTEAPEHPPILIRVASSEKATILECITPQRHSCPHELSSVFEPFVTSWADSKHIGLGLTVAAGIVERCGGSIEIEERKVESGFEFITRIILKPGTHQFDEVRSDASGQEKTSDVPEYAIAPGTRILIIDDEPTVATAIARILELGVASPEDLTIECISGEQALEEFKKQEKVDLILCDLNLAGMSGRHIFETVCKSRPELVARFVFITGDTGRRESEMYLNSAGRPFLGKPFEPNELLRLAEKLLSASTAKKDPAP
jgi:CheY-like chemotaxis protein